MSIDLLKRKLETMAIIFLIVVLLVAIATVFSQVKFGSKSKLLVVQNFPPGSDAYAISQSNEYVSSILASVVTSDSFYREVMAVDGGIDKTYFTKNSNEHALEMFHWKETVSARTKGDTGIVEVSVVHPSRDQALKIIDAIDKVLVEKDQLFHGGGDNVTVKVVDDPSVSVAQPKIMVNAALAVFLGVLISMAYIYLLPGEQYDLKVLGRRR